MMTLLFGQNTNIVRELEGIDEVRKRKVPLQALDLVSNNERPLRHLSVKFKTFLCGNNGSPSVTGLTLHSH
jgi:hypothetical protein